MPNQSRINVEELQQRLKWMEDQFRRVVKHQVSGLDTDLGSVGQKIPNSDKSRTKTLYSEPNTYSNDPSNDLLQVAQESFKANKVGQSSRNGNYKLPG
jgi:hypothetical protein